MKSVQIETSWSTFSRIRNEYRDLRSKFLHLVRMQENMDQKKHNFYYKYFPTNSWNCLDQLPHRSPLNKCSLLWGFPLNQLFSQTVSLAAPSMTIVNSLTINFPIIQKIANWSPSQMLPRIFLTSFCPIL